MGASSSKNDRSREAFSDDDDTPRKRRKKDTCGEEADRQLAVSGVKVEAKPVHSSPEVLELRQYLLMAKQAQINAEQLVINTAQQLLDTEQQAVKKEEIYQSELREATLRAERAEKELESARGVAREKAMLEAKVNQLEDKEKRAYQLICELTNEVEEERKRVSEREKRIEELKRKLAGNEAGEPEVVEIADAPVNATVRIDLNVDNFAHPTNIFRLLRPDTSNAISLDEAVDWIRASFEKCGDMARGRCLSKATNFDCRVCGLEMPNKMVVTDHFLSEEHIGKVRASGASVSKTAISNWANILDKFADWEKKRIERLEQFKQRKLAGDEAGEQEVVEIADAPANATVRIDRSVDNFAHPTNIFRLVRPAITNAMSLDEAVKRMLASFEKCGEKARKRCEEKATNFDCRVCGLEMPNKLVVTTHFLSEEHIGKVRASGASVSNPAICHWANMLDNLADWEKKGIEELKRKLTGNEVDEPEVVEVADAPIRWRHY